MAVSVLRSRPRPRPRPTLIHLGGLLTVFVLGASALLSGRPELAALATLFGFDFFRRASVSYRVVRAPVRLDSEGQLVTELDITGQGPPPDAIVVRLAGISGAPTEAVLATSKPDQRASTPLPEPDSDPVHWQRIVPSYELCTRSGAVELLRLETRCQTSSGAIGPLTLPAVRYYLEPVATELPPLPRPRQLVGAWGPRETQRAGTGTRFFDVAPLTRGDRLSRISWRTTARHAVGEDLVELYAARSHSGAESVVMIVLDPRDDVGRDVDSWAGGSARSATAITSLDLARNAALSLANAHLNAGDRVGLIDLANPATGVTAATGIRARQRITRYLTTVQPPHHAPSFIRPPRIVRAAQLWLISTLLDDVTLDLALNWSHCGRSITVIDILPDDLVSQDRAVAAALDLELAERAIRLRTLAEAGISVIAWPALNRPDLVAFRQAQLFRERR